MVDMGTPGPAGEAAHDQRPPGRLRRAAANEVGVPEASLGRGAPMGLVVIDHEDSSISSKYVDHFVLGRQNLAALALRICAELRTAVRVRIFSDDAGQPAVDTDVLPGGVQGERIPLDSQSVSGRVEGEAAIRRHRWARKPAEANGRPPSP